MFQTKVVQIIETNLFFFFKLCYLQDNVENIIELGRPQMVIRCMPLHAGYQRLQTHSRNM